MWEKSGAFEEQSEVGVAGTQCVRESDKKARVESEEVGRNQIM